MFSTHVINLVLFSYPEAITLVIMMLILIGTKMNWKKVLISAIFIGTCAYFSRFLNSNYIINILIYISLMTAALTFYKVSGLFERFVCSTITLGIYVMIEYVFLTFITSILDIPLQTLISSVTVRFMCFAPQLFFAIIVTYLFRRFRLSIFNS